MTTQTDDERTNKSIEAAMRIIRPERTTAYMPGMVFGRTRHLWQHVEACRDRVVGAIDWTAAEVELGPAGGGGRENRIRKVRKERAVRCADELLEYGDRGLPTATTKENGGALSELSTILYYGATGQIGEDHDFEDMLLRPTIVDHNKENWAWLGRGRNRVKPASDEPNEEMLRLAIADAAEREKEWLEPPPASA